MMEERKGIRKMIFSQLEITPMRIHLLAEYDEWKLPLWFEFDRPINVSSSNVAIALSTLCGTRFDFISFDFEISLFARDCIEKFTKSTVEAPLEGINFFVPRKDNHIVSFSGGFDSIAVAELLGDSAKLVSLDFGGWFEREADYFRKYDTLSVSTNIRRQPSQKNSLARNHWLFMAIGAILTAEYFEASYHSFGTILGNSFAKPAKTRSLIPLRAAGLAEVPVTDGITEVGTTRIMVQVKPEEVADSLDSLAGERDRKNFYKRALVTLVARDLEVESPIAPLGTDWTARVKFSDSYTTALSALYFIARGEEDLIAPLFEEIPEGAFEVASELRMDFMNRANYDYYQSVPSKIRHHLIPKLDELGFIPYTEKDWDEIAIVRRFLSTVFE